MADKEVVIKKKDLKASVPNEEDVEHKKPIKASKVVLYIGLIFWALVNLFPLYFMFTFSLKDNKEILGANIIGLPKNWLWSNYSQAVNTGRMGTYFINSIIVTVATIAISLIAALMATYAMTRLVWKGRKAMNKFFMLGLTIPIHAAIVPVFITLSKLHVLNTYSSLIVPYAAFALSMAILICTGFMCDIPIDLDEAACIDGCSTTGIFFRIILPLMKPAFATSGIYTFLQAWNELMFATVFISDSDYKTLPVGINELAGRHTTEWGPIGAALVLATFPMLLAYIFLSRKIQDSFIAGAIKG